MTMTATPMTDSDFRTMVRAISHAAPRLRFVSRCVGETVTMNKLFSAGTMTITPVDRLYSIAGPMTPENIGRAVLALLMAGTLGKHVAASDNNMDCVLVIMPPAVIDGQTVMLRIGVERETR